MLKINSLCKTYRSRNNKSDRALNNVDLTLPDNGLIFLLGKNGSGKSTFLNLLGGLDSATSGKIVVDGHDLSQFNKSQLSDYRNTYVGFIFQDYCLIDELTVYDNVSIALEFKGVIDSNDVNEALKTVGLDGYANKYPSELSGGERQRVAIARAIIKKPRIILADEPTGNLDADATEDVFNLLKSLSKDSLVFIVSHDKDSAHKYADRIIMLENGEIVADENNSADDKVILVSDKKNNGKVSEKFNRLFVNKIGWLFLKRKFPKIALYSFMVAIIMTVMVLAQTITRFDSAEVMKNEFKGSRSDSIFLTKTLDYTQKTSLGKLNKVVNSFPKIDESDIEAFRKAGYKGSIYNVLKCNLNIGQSRVSTGMATNVFDESLYVLEPLGIMVVDEKFLTEKYGGLEYLAKADEFHPTGVIITDYLADIMLKSEQLQNINDYNSLIGEYRWGNDEASRCVLRGYINAVINTGYKDKYKSILDKVEKYGSDYIEKALKDNDFVNLVDDIHTKYGFCYSLNPNFEQDAVNNPSWDMVWHYALKFGNGSLFTTDIPQVRKAKNYGIELGKNEVLMEMTAYNNTFGTQYTEATIESFTPHTETLSHYLYSELGEDDALFTQDVSIVGLFVVGQNNKSGTFIAGESIYNLFAENHIYTTGLYFGESDNKISVIDTAAEKGFNNNLIVGESLRTMTKVVEIFVPIFRMIAVILCSAIVLILINFSSKMINDKIKEIGILKAIGAKNRTIGSIFGVQILLISLLTCILSIAGYFLFVNQTNDLLLNSLQTFATEKMIPDLTFLTFRVDIVVQNCVLVLVLAAISYIVPMIKICKLEPVKIIRSED